MNTTSSSGNLSVTDLNNQTETATPPFDLTTLHNELTSSHQIINDSDVAAIVGSSIGALFIIVVLVLVFYSWLCKKKKSMEKTDPKDTTSAYNTNDKTENTYRKETTGSYEISTQQQLELNRTDYSSQEFRNSYQPEAIYANDTPITYVNLQAPSQGVRLSYNSQEGNYEEEYCNVQRTSWRIDAKDDQDEYVAMN